MAKQRLQGGRQHRHVTGLFVGALAHAFMLGDSFKETLVRLHRLLGNSSL